MSVVGILEWAENDERHSKKKYLEIIEAEKEDKLLRDKKATGDKQAKEIRKLVKKQQERKGKLNEKDEKLQGKGLSEDLERANELMSEANGRLAAAIKAKDF
ncbi:hypothetical protein DPMN_091324 [Dreissena polymorpha]|uniref:Uncharacterized protein n=1 Tax=Dreissena polymorpha TaxID=45954 RepID=A0A9D4QZ49_DREPO|nr:hypothetical protein DPMN_091324 [Dreissena polymorpha]